MKEKLTTPGRIVFNYMLLNTDIHGVDTQQELTEIMLAYSQH